MVTEKNSFHLILEFQEFSAHIIWKPSDVKNLHIGRNDLCGVYYQLDKKL